MDPTSVSLLDRLRAAPPYASDWGRLQEIYDPLIRSWLRRIPGIGGEADDLAQEGLPVANDTVGNGVKLSRISLSQ